MMQMFAVRYNHLRAARPSEIRNTTLISAVDLPTAEEFAQVYMRGINEYNHRGTRWTENYQIVEIERLRA
jgi:hypothetical protein